MQNNIQNPETPYPWSTPLPTFQGGATQNSSGQNDQAWNEAWNYGYTHANTSVSPYSGYAAEGYNAGKNQYISDLNKNKSSGTPTPQAGPAPSVPSAPSGPSAPSYEDIMRGQIEGGYNSYFSELDNMLNKSLPGQRSAQEGLATNSFNTSVNDLGLQKESNLADLQTQERKASENQVKTLADVSSNIRNLMQSGNTYLGSMGAGDSSAVNQYAYGLTKLGSQQRGDVQSQTTSIMNDIADRESKLGNIYMQEKNRLQGELNTQMGSIAQWFSEKQQELQMAKANGQLAKSTDLQSLTTNLYNAAVSQLTNIQNQAAQRQATLESWAANNSKTLGELKANMSSIGSFQAPGLSYSAVSNPLSMQASSNKGYTPYGGSAFGGLSEEQKRLLGM